MPHDLPAQTDDPRIESQPLIDYVEGVPEFSGVPDAGDVVEVRTVAFSERPPACQLEADRYPPRQTLQWLKRLMRRTGLLASRDPFGVAEEPGRRPSAPS